MNCHRCHGLMSAAELRDWQSSAGEDRSDAFRCILCGEIVDPVVMSNRKRVMGMETPPRKARARHSIPVIVVGQTRNPIPKVLAWRDAPRTYRPG